jgi:hypothetical protein
MAPNMIEPRCLIRDDVSTGLFPGDFAELGKWFRQPSAGVGLPDDRISPRVILRARCMFNPPPWASGFTAAGSHWRALELSDGAENKSGIAVYHPCITEQIVGIDNALIFLVPARTR